MVNKKEEKRTMMRTQFFIGEAANFIPCHPNTLRRLDKLGAIKAKRNFLGYRVFDLQDLLKLKAQREAYHLEEAIDGKRPR